MDEVKDVEKKEKEEEEEDEEKENFVRDVAPRSSRSSSNFSGLCRKTCQMIDIDADYADIIKIIIKILSVLLYLYKRLVFHICIGPNEKAVTEVY